METINRTEVALFDALTGPRVVVRPYQEAQAEQLFAAIEESRADLSRWIRFADTHSNIEDSRAWLKKVEAEWQARTDLTAGIWDKSTGCYLGDTRIYPVNWETGYFNFSYWVRTSGKGQGYISEAVGLLRDYALNSLAATRLEITCDSRNTASANVARRAGFTLEGQLRNHRLGRDGTLITTLIFGFISTDQQLSS